MGVLGRLVMMPNPFIKLLELTGLGLGPANSDEALNGLADSMAAGGAAMADLFCLTKAQIQRITPYFPLSHEVPRVDDQRVDGQRVVSGILHVIRNGLRWRACLKGALPRCIGRTKGGFHQTELRQTSGMPGNEGCRLWNWISRAPCITGRYGRSLNYDNKLNALKPILLDNDKREGGSQCWPTSRSWTLRTLVMSSC
jgi:hypothetical protein